MASGTLLSMSEQNCQKMPTFALDHWPEILQKIASKTGVCRMREMLTSCSSLDGTWYCSKKGRQFFKHTMQNLALWNAHWRLHWRHIAGYTQEHSEEFDGKLSVNFLSRQSVLLVCVVCVRVRSVPQCERVCRGAAWRECLHCWPCQCRFTDSISNVKSWPLWGESWLWQTWFRLLRRKPNRQAFARATSDPRW